MSAGTKSSVDGKKLWCPQRRGTPFQNIKDDFPDTWVENQWLVGKTSEKEQIWRGERTILQSGTIWLDAWGKEPRACSFCGSIHLEDLKVMLAAGWTANQADRKPKYYIEAPGHKEYFEKMLSGDSTTKQRQNIPDAVRKSPAPSIKLYIRHMSQDDIEEVNEVIRKGRIN